MWATPNGGCVSGTGLFVFAERHSSGGDDLTVEIKKFIFIVCLCTPIKRVWHVPLMIHDLCLSVSSPATFAASPAG